MLSIMVGKTPKNGAGRRIAELEAEGAQVRGRLETPGDPERISGEGEDEGLKTALGPASRTKVIATAAGIAVLAFAAFFVMFFLMSSGLDRVARTAAKGFVPDEPPASSVSPTEASAPDGAAVEQTGR
jgi:hypothetical protein